MEGAQSLESDVVVTQRSATATPVVDLLSVLQATLGLVDQRAMNLTALLLASLVAVWTQLHAFSSGAPAVLAWIAWGVLVLALLVMARVMLPHRLAKLGQSVIGSEDFPCRFGPDDEVEVLAGATLAVRDEIDWLRKHIMVAAALGVLALAAVVVAYVVQKT
jgi:hypothetical protein